VAMGSLLWTENLSQGHGTRTCGGDLEAAPWRWQPGLVAYVLVHGGGFSRSCWDDIRPWLNAPSVAVDLPGRGRRPADLASVTLADFAASVVGTILEDHLDQVTLVGHSMAGLTLPRVAALVPERLNRLVFISCAVPPSGVSLLEVLGGLSPGAQEVVARLGEDAVDDGGSLHPALATAMFCNDMDADQVASTLRRMGPESLAVLAEPSDLYGLSYPIPRTYVRLLRDASIELDTQNEMIANLGETEVVDLDAGHMAMISRPKALADIINGL
jgi:pimeloyl-ACP methyl ester carboxylesterase